MEIKEDLLHFIWKYRLFNLPLIDMNDLPVDLVDPGQHNRDAGPDFFNARIRSEGILWAGNIEIHRKASDWYLHGHHLDPSFDNVILHVVLEPDCQVRNSKDREIMTVRLEITPVISRQYGLLMNNPELIPCWRNLKNVNQGRFDLWLERLLVERLEERINWVFEMLDRCSGDWNEVLYNSLARAFGQKVNSVPFEMLARSVSFKTIIDHCPDQTSKEALLFGQAGMLERWTQDEDGFHKWDEKKGHIHQAGPPIDDYHAELLGKYKALQRMILKETSTRHQPIDGFLWKFLRLRPDNFPTIRISQLAFSLDKYPDIFRQLVGADDPLDFVMKMEIRASEYWTSHYRFGSKSPAREKRMGKNRLRGLFINAFLPVLFAYHRIDRKSLIDVDFQGLMAGMPAEDNRIIRMWKSLGREVPDVFSSQALLQLTNKYCRFKKCLSCYVGSQIIQSPPGNK